jgi:beta-hydroxylase
VDPLIRRLDDVLSEAVFFESSLPVYQFRIDGQVWTAKGGEGIEPGVTAAPTCVVEISREHLGAMLEQHLDPNHLVRDARLRVGGLNFDIFLLFHQLVQGNKKSAYPDVYLKQCSTSTAKKRRLAAKAEQAMLEKTATSKAQVQRIIDMMDRWVDHKIAEPALDRWEKVPVPGLETSPWMDVAELGFDPLVKAAFPTLRREASQFIRGEVRAPYYGTDNIDNAALAPTQGFRNWNLVEYFEKVPANCRQFPETTALIEEIAKHITITHAGFLILEAGAQLWAHADGLAWGISYQYGLIVPENCWLKVLDKKHQHAEGRAIAFNDSYLHSAANDSKEMRVLFLVTCANPHFSRAEQESLRLISDILPDGAICYPR